MGSYSVKRARQATTACLALTFFRGCPLRRTVPTPSAPYPETPGRSAPRPPYPASPAPPSSAPGGTGRRSRASARAPRTQSPHPLTKRRQTAPAPARPAPGGGHCSRRTPGRTAAGTGNPPPSGPGGPGTRRSEEHTSETPVTIRDRMPPSALKKKKKNIIFM